MYPTFRRRFNRPTLTFFRRMNIPHRRVYVHVPHHFFHRADRCAAINCPCVKRMTPRAVKVDVGDSGVTQRLPPSRFNGRDRLARLQALKQVAGITSLITWARLPVRKGMSFSSSSYDR